VEARALPVSGSPLSALYALYPRSGACYMYMYMYMYMYPYMYPYMYMCPRSGAWYRGIHIYIERRVV